MGCKPYPFCRVKALWRHVFVPPFAILIMKMKIEQKKRIYSVAFKTGLVLGIGLIYAAFVRLTGWGIPCVFNLVTGMQCPGCGISRMFLALLKLDFTAAAQYNLLVLCLLPFALALFLYKTWKYVKNGETAMSMSEKILYCISLVLCFVFFIVRNTTDLI